MKRSAKQATVPLLLVGWNLALLSSMLHLGFSIEMAAGMLVLAMVPVAAVLALWMIL